MPVAVAVVEFFMGSFGFGLDVFSLISGEEDNSEKILKKLEDIDTQLTGLGSQIAQLEVDQSLSETVDYVMGVHKFYINNIAPLAKEIGGPKSISEPQTIKLLDELYANPLVATWVESIYHPGDGMVSRSDAIKAQVMGSPIHGEGVIKTVFTASHVKHLGVRPGQQWNLPIDQTRNGAQNIVADVSNLLVYIFNVQGLATGMLLTSDILDKLRREREEQLKKRIRDLWSAVEPEYMEAKNLLVLFGSPSSEAAKIYHDVERLRR